MIGRSKKALVIAVFFGTMRSVAFGQGFFGGVVTPLPPTPPPPQVPLPPATPGLTATPVTSLLPPTPTLLPFLAGIPSTTLDFTATPLDFNGFGGGGTTAPFPLLELLLALLLMLVGL